MGCFSFVKSLLPEFLTWDTMWQYPVPWLQVTSSSKMECHPIFIPTREHFSIRISHNTKISQADPTAWLCPHPKSAFSFLQCIYDIPPPLDWHRDKTVAAFANIHAGMLNHVWGNHRHNAHVTYAITTFSVVKTQKNLKCKRTWKSALICAIYNHMFAHLGVSTAF